MFNPSLFRSFRTYRLYVIVFLAISSCNWSREASNTPSEVQLVVPQKISKDATYFNAQMPSIWGVNPYGDSFDLRQIDAKYILIEFWASWCPPCRKANPGLVEVYNKYKQKGFEIVSISLDEKKEKWKNAIESDGLIWPYHLCDYKGWDSKWAREYKIEEIPNNVLYNSEGKIMATSLEPSALDKILKELLVK